MKFLEISLTSSINFENSLTFESRWDVKEDMQIDISRTEHATFIPQNVGNIYWKTKEDDSTLFDFVNSSDISREIHGNWTKFPRFCTFFIWILRRRVAPRACKERFSGIYFIPGSSESGDFSRCAAPRRGFPTKGGNPDRGWWRRTADSREGGRTPGRGDGRIRESVTGGAARTRTRPLSGR